jgi:hypothetical protein
MSVKLPSLIFTMPCDDGTGPSAVGVGLGASVGTGVGSFLVGDGVAVEGSAVGAAANSASTYLTSTES